MPEIEFAETFTPREVEYKTSSGRVFKIKELSAFEQMQADSCSDTLSGSMYYRMAMSMVSIDGKPAPAEVI